MLADHGTQSQDHGLSATRSEFAANYKARYPRWGWKRIPHRLVQLMLKRLFNREQEGIQIVPTELNLDPVAGYPNNNGDQPYRLRPDRRELSLVDEVRALALLTGKTQHFVPNGG